MLAPGGFSRATPPPCRSPAWPRPAGAPEKFVGIHFFCPVRQDEAGGNHPRQGRPTTRRGARLRLCAGHRQDAHRRQRLARLLHHPRVRHLRDGRRGHGRRRHPRGGRRAGGRCRPACRWGRWRCWTRPRCRCRCTCWTRRAPTSPPRAARYIASPGESAGRAHGQGVRPQWPRGGRRLLRLSGRAARSACGRELKQLFERPASTGTCRS